MFCWPGRTKHSSLLKNSATTSSGDTALSVLTAPPVAVVDLMVDRHGTRRAAEEYVKYLYSPEGQEIAARHFYRPRLAAAAAKYGSQFPKINLFTVDELFGGWQKAQKTQLRRRRNL